MNRETLRNIITSAATEARCAPEDVQRLATTADLIDKVAVATFLINEEGVHCGCPATVAGYFDPAVGSFRADTPWAVRDQFPGRFDKAIYESGESRVTTHYNRYIEVTD